MAIFETTRAVFNNLNQIKYLKNINKVKLKKENPMENRKDLMPYNSKPSIEKLKELESDIRVTNLQNFVSSYAYLKAQQFVVVTVPAILGAVALGLSVAPSKYTSEGKITTYDVKEITYNSELGEIYNSYVGYKRGGWNSTVKNTVVDPGEMTMLPSVTNSRLNFKIYDGMDAVFAEFIIYSNGELSLSSSKLVDYIELDSIKDAIYQELDDEYPVVFDKVIDMLNNSRSVSDSTKEILKKLTDSEKKTIIMEIVKYTKLADEKVMMNKSTKVPRNILFFMMIAYIAIETGVIFINDLEPGKTKNLYYNKGKLSRDGIDSELGIIFGPTKLKEAFLAAERERILRIKDEIAENLEEGSYQKLLTRYERKVK